jgi:hypothetical protein
MEIENFAKAVRGVVKRKERKKILDSHLRHELTALEREPSLASR